MYDARKCDIYASTPSVSISEFEVDWYARLASQDGSAVPPAPTTDMTASAVTDASSDTLNDTENSELYASTPYVPFSEFEVDTDAGLASQDSFPVAPPPTTDMTASAVTDASSDTPPSVPFSEFEVDTDAWLASQDSFPVAPPPTTALASAGPSDMGENYQGMCASMSAGASSADGRAPLFQSGRRCLPGLPSQQAVCLPETQLSARCLFFFLPLHPPCPRRCRLMSLRWPVPRAPRQSPEVERTNPISARAAKVRPFVSLCIVADLFDTGVVGNRVFHAEVQFEATPP